MIFSQNQVSQVYVSNSITVEINPLDSTSNVGAIYVGKSADKSHFYIQHKGAGGITRSDLINPSKVISASRTAASKMCPQRCNHAVQLRSDINAGAPVTAQDYVLRINFRSFPTQSDENVYSKDFAVHVFGTMTASTFYKKMAIQAAKSFARETVPLVKIYLSYLADGETSNAWGLGASAEEVTVNTKEADIPDHSYIGLVFVAEQQPWRRGMGSFKVDFTLSPTTIEFGGDEVIWGKTDTYNPTTGENTPGITPGKYGQRLFNSQLAADYEYFAMKNRADQYGAVGYPDNIETEYLVKPDTDYHFINIHYYTDESNENVQRSEKDLVIMVADITDGGLMFSTNTLATELNKYLPVDKQLPV